MARERRKNFKIRRMDMLAFDDSSSTYSRSVKFFAAAALAAVLLYLAPLGSYPLMEPDEGRYAEIPREMVESGDFVTPRLNYVKYFEKPVLLYWANAANFMLFGENEFAARFFPALCALGGVFVTAAFGASLYGRRAGFIAGAVTATSLLYFAIGTINITDMPLTFFLTLAFASFYTARTSGRKRWYLLFYFASALAVLTKGLVGVFLPGLVILVYILVTREWRLFVEPLYLPGLLLFFAAGVPWFWAVCRENPDFFRFFFVQEHFLRYTTKMHGRYEPFWYFLPLLPAGLAPWTAFLPALLSRRSVVRAPRCGSERRANIYLLLWAGLILLFFSMSDSKLIPYIVPCLPPLALLIGADIDRMIAEHRATKRYLAIVEGAFPWHERTFDSPIGRDRHDSRRMRISRTGKHAVSHARLLRSATIGRRTFSLLSVVIETGRKHQIRVHLSSSGFPIVGDALYGHNHPLGLMLHARELSFIDPVDGNPVDIVSPVPARFAAIAAEFESEAPIDSRRS